jgi:signal transduction histidine kinase
MYGVKIYTVRIIGLLALSAFLIYIGLVITFQYVRETVSENRSESIQFVASEIHDQVIELKLMNNLIKLQQHLQNYVQSGEVEVYKLHVLNKNLEVIASSDISYIKKKFTDMSYKQVKERSRSYVINQVADGEKIVECAYPIKASIFSDSRAPVNHAEGEVLGILLVWRKLSPLNEMIHSNYSSWGIVFVLLGILLVVILIGVYVNKFFVNLGSISGTAKKLAAGNLNERLEFDKNSEFGLLADSFNQIADNLENRIKETTFVNKKLEESNVEKEKQVSILSQMAGGVAHEIRNPLGGIRGFAELLKNEIDAGDEKKNRYINYILDEVKTLECLVQNVLDFARPKPPNKSKVFTEILMEALANIVESKIEAIRKSNNKKIEYTFKINEGAGEFSADPGQMRQVILNLALNACEAMSETGGRLDVDFSPAALEILKKEYGATGDENIKKLIDSAASDASYIRLSVSDTGCGMDKKILDNLFAPFFTTRASGTGLGLSICKKIVENHRGFMCVKSEPGKGTAFFIVLPAA